MSNTFNLHRFINLLKKIILERPLQIFGLMGLNMAVITILYFLLRSTIGWYGTQNLTFIWGFILCGCYLASSMFGYFSSNASGCNYLMLPASHFEKWLCAMLIVWVLYVAIFLLGYYILDSSFVQYYYAHLDTKDPDYQRKFEMVQPFEFTENVAIKTYTAFGILSAATFVGSLYYNKLGFIKTAIWVCSLFVGIYALNMVIAQLLFDNVSGALPFSHVALTIDTKPPVPDQISEMAIWLPIQEGDIQLPARYSNIFSICIRYLLTATLCLAAYLRLREKEF